MVVHGVEDLTILSEVIDDQVVEVRGRLVEGCRKRDRDGTAKERK